VSLLQYPLGGIAARGGLATVNMWQFVSMCSTVLFAFFHQWRENQKSEALAAVYTHANALIILTANGIYLICHCLSVYQ
jgi:hypothetical protein